MTGAAPGTAPGPATAQPFPVLVTRRLPAPAMTRLAARCDLFVHEGDDAMPRAELLDRIAGRAGAVTLLTDRVDEELLGAAGPQLRIVANYAVGYDNIDVAACTARGVLVSNTPEVLSEATADLAFALLLAAARRVAEGDRWIRAGRPWVWGPQFLLGGEVHGKQLGLIGFGRIGQAVARRALGFAMSVVYADVRAQPASVERELGATRVELRELLAGSDFVSIHTTLTDQTRRLLDAERLAWMKPTAVLVNTARGPIVDEAALAAALRAGRLRAAGLDVYEHEPEVHPDLLACPQAVLLPHLGSATDETRQAMADLAVDNLLTALDGGRPPTAVNPEVLDRPTAPRPG